MRAWPWVRCLAAIVVLPNSLLPQQQPPRAQALFAIGPDVSTPIAFCLAVAIASTRCAGLGGVEEWRPLAFAFPLPGLTCIQMRIQPHSSRHTTKALCTSAA